MSDLPTRPLTLPELAALAGEERRVIWRAVQAGLIRADRQMVGSRHTAATIHPDECARVVRACSIARALQVPAAGILRARDLRSDGHIVTFSLPGEVAAA